MIVTNQKRRMKVVANTMKKMTKQGIYKADMQIGTSIHHREWQAPESVDGVLKCGAADEGD